MKAINFNRAANLNHLIPPAQAMGLSVITAICLAFTSVKYTPDDAKERLLLWKDFAGEQALKSLHNLSFSISSLSTLIDYLDIDFGQGLVDGVFIPNLPLDADLFKTIHVSSPFGIKRNMTINGKTTNRVHKGVDLAIPVGTPVYSMIDGTILKAGDEGDAGNLVKIKGNLPNGDEIIVWYMHLDDIAHQVQAGTTVKSGQLIAHSGNSGRSTGPHLHLQLQVANQLVDPLAYIKNAIAQAKTASRKAYLTDEQWQIIIDGLVKREASNKWNHPGNTLCYIGGIQAGAGFLVDAGLIKPHKYIAAAKYDKWQCQFLANPDNWTEGNSYESFINNKELQIQLFKAQATKNIRKALADNVLSNQASVQDIASLVFVAHLLGLEGKRGAYDYFKKGINSTDAYGTSAKVYDEYARGLFK